MVQKNVVQNIKFQKNVASKNVWVQKHFGSQKILSSKVWGTKNLGKMIWL